MFNTCLVGGPFHGRQSKFKNQPADVLVMPHEDGFFLRYRKSSDQPSDGAIVFVFVERFEGQR
jgi:hypothetical protein